MNASARWDARHPERRQEIRRSHARRRRERFRTHIREYLSTHPCVDCGEVDPVVLDFDHVRGEKEFDISKAAKLGKSWDHTLGEIAKCEVRCANCHRRVTHRRRLSEAA